MKLVKYLNNDAVDVGILEDNRVYSLATDSMSKAFELVANGKTGQDSAKSVALDNISILPPIDSHNKILCVALNYIGHVKEAKQSVPESPIIFFKTQEALIPAGAEISNLNVIKQLDYEGELAIIIGKDCFDVKPDKAWEHIAGITAFNDTCARDLLRVKAGENIILDWFSAKCLNKSTPVGPVAVTFDEVEDDLRRGELSVITRVNGKEVQRAKTADMIFDIPTILSLVSSRIELKAGDIIATGTPPGIGASTGSFLTEGDVVEIDIAPIPVLRNKVSAPLGNTGG